MPWTARPSPSRPATASCRWSSSPAINARTRKRSKTASSTLGREYAKRGVAFYAIDSNDDAAYSVESPAEMKSRAQAKNYPFPYLKDGDSRIARAYGARVTPHIFVVDGKGVIRYRGYVDDSAKPEERQHTGLHDALESLLGNKDVAVTDDESVRLHDQVQTGGVGKRNLRLCDRLLGALDSDCPCARLRVKCSSQIA